MASLLSSVPSTSGRMHLASSGRRLHLAAPATTTRWVSSARSRPTPCQGFLGLGGPNTVATSVDPSPALKSYSPGRLLSVHSPEEVRQLLASHHDKLVVLQCKASHCRPCKAFLKTYIHLAEVFRDSVLAEITGDETPDTRKLMMEWKIKTTPTFRVYRDGELVASFSGAKERNLVEAITTNLRPTEQGYGYKLVETTNSDDD